MYGWELIAKCIIIFTVEIISCRTRCHEKRREYTEKKSKKHAAEERWGRMNKFSKRYIYKHQDFGSVFSLSEELF